MSVIQIKRRTSPHDFLHALADGELGYIKSTNQLYIGTNEYGNVWVNATNSDAATKSYVDSKINAISKAYLSTKIITANDTTSVTFDVNNIDINNCLVYCNGILLIPTENYTVAADKKTINLVDRTAENGDYFSVTYRVSSTSGNDYAEYREQIDIIEPGYCVASTDEGKVFKTTKKFQACDGIVSDTFGFSIGETEQYRTPLAIAGRVLAYCEGNRYDYHAGDTVCAGPDGKVVKMTREEIKEYPDRIIGHVSEIPEYEIWGDKEIKVNGRIWIRVR